MGKLSSLLALTLLMLMTKALYAAPAVYNLQLTIANEDFGNDNEDTTQKLTASVRSVVGITRNSAFNLNADLYTRNYNDFNKLDSNGILLEAIYSYVPSAGFTKPTYLIGLRHEHEVFDNEKRDFDKTSLILATALRIDDRVTITPGLEYYQKSSDISESDVIGLFLNTDLRINQNWLGYINLKLQSEDITITSALNSRSSREAIAGHHTPGESGGNTPSLPTPGSGTDVDTDSNNIILTIGANYSIDRHHAIDVSYERLEYSFSSSPDITGNVISFDYFYKF